MKIIFGLGNPGFWYRNSRHNAGFMVCRAVAEKHGWKFKRKGFHSRYCRGLLNGTDTVLALPQTYMNRSGIAVAGALAAFGARAPDVLVVVDDFQLPLGTLRFRKQGSGGGHNGLESICAGVGEEFCRLRLGIGPRPVEKDVVKFVLGSFTRAEKKAVACMVERAADAVLYVVQNGIEKAMNEYNS